VRMGADQLAQPARLPFLFVIDSACRFRMASCTASQTITVSTMRPRRRKGFVAYARATAPPSTMCVRLAKLRMISEELQNSWVGQKLHYRILQRLLTAITRTASPHPVRNLISLKEFPVYIVTAGAGAGQCPGQGRESRWESRFCRCRTIPCGLSSPGRVFYRIPPPPGSGSLPYS